MSEPHDFRLERLRDRDGRRSPHLGEIAHVGSPLAGSSTSWRSQAAYEALIDAVFTGPGALAWLSGLQRAVAAMLADMDSTPHVPTAYVAGPRLWRP
jgi:hypothetical protein